MIAVRPMLLGMIAALPMLLIGCGGTPYIYNNNEFDRQSDYYLNGVADRDVVEVCFDKRKATPKMISDLAVSECRKFGKIAVFSNTSRAVCPLDTPVAAVYTCASQETQTGNAGS